MGMAKHFDQDELDTYFADLRRADEEKPKSMQESKSTHDHRLAAVKFYLVDLSLIHI